METHFVGDFKPQINKHSEKMVHRNGNVIEKLIASREVSEQKRKMLKEDLERKQIENCTFIPQINKRRPSSAKKPPSQKNTPESPAKKVTFAV